MTGSRREQFRHFVLMSEVSSAVASCKPPLNYAHSCPLYRFSLHVFLLRPVLVSLNLGHISVEVTPLLGTTVFLTLI